MRPSILAACLVGSSAFAVLTACGGGSSSSVPSTGPTAVPQQQTASTLSSTTIAGAQTTLSGSAQSLSLPSIPGVSTVGGANSDHFTINAPTGVTAIVTVAGSAEAGTSGGPSVTLSSSGRHVMSIGGVSVTPLYYVGVTNTTGTSTQVTFSSLSLGLGGAPPSGASVGLAHYDPSKPQNGWVVDCAFGSSQVTVNGGNVTFLPGGGNFSPTLYPGATLWFAPYEYPSTVTATPSPPPAATPVPPTATAPPSLTGTYIGSAQQTSPTSQSAQYAELQFTQNGSSLTGTLGVVPASSQQGGFFGSLSGTVSGSTVALTATPASFDTNSCGATINAVASGNLIYGTFTSPPCSGGNDQTVSGTFSFTLQTQALASLSGTYTGSINDSVNGAGTLTFALSQGGTVFSGTGTTTFPSNPSANGSNPVVGFAVNATTAEFFIIETGNDNCSPSGTITVNGNTLTGTYSGTNAANSSSCTGTGTFSITK